MVGRSGSHLDPQCGRGPPQTRHLERKNPVAETRCHCVSVQPRTASAEQAWTLACDFSCILFALLRQIHLIGWMRPENSRWRADARISDQTQLVAPCDESRAAGGHREPQPERGSGAGNRTGGGTIRHEFSCAVRTLRTGKELFASSGARRGEPSRRDSPPPR